MKLIRIDKILWKVYYGEVTPLCPNHKIEMDSKFGFGDDTELVCAECSESYNIPRGIMEQRLYVLRKLESIDLRKIKVLNLDGEAVPIAETKTNSDDDRFFVKAILMNSKVGMRLVIYAGEKGRQEKTQIFIEPQIKRVAFDQNDLHPSEVFLKVEAQFEDGKEVVLKSGKK